MKCKCMDCGKKFRNQGALNMHARDKHPQMVLARARASMAKRKLWLSPFTRGFWSGVLVLLSALTLPVVAAVQTQAITVSQGVVTLKPWSLTVEQAQPIAKAERKNK